MKENKLLKPAILYKDEIERKYCEYFYSREMYQLMGCGTSAIPQIKASGNDPGFRQFAIVDLEGNCIGYLHYTIYFDRRLVDTFELLGFVSTPLIGKALYDELYRLSHIYHLVTFGAVGSNPVIKHYMYACKKLKGSYVVERDVIMDNECNLDDYYRFQILNPNEQYASKVEVISEDFSVKDNNKELTENRIEHSIKSSDKMNIDLLRRIFQHGSTKRFFMDNDNLYEYSRKYVLINAKIVNIWATENRIDICIEDEWIDTIQLTKYDFIHHIGDDITIMAEFNSISAIGEDILKVRPIASTEYPYNCVCVNISNVSLILKKYEDTIKNCINKKEAILYDDLTENKIEHRIESSDKLEKSCLMSEELMKRIFYTGNLIGVFKNYLPVFSNKYLLIHATVKSCKYFDTKTEIVIDTGVPYHLSCFNSLIYDRINNIHDGDRITVMSEFICVSDTDKNILRVRPISSSNHVYVDISRVGLVLKRMKLIKL